jgi:hypothetical protein
MPSNPLHNNVSFDWRVKKAWKGPDRFWWRVVDVVYLFLLHQVALYVGLGVFSGFNRTNLNKQLGLKIVITKYNFKKLCICHLIVSNQSQAQILPNPVGLAGGWLLVRICSGRTVPLASWW